MRNIPENIMNYLRQGERFVYCFKFSKDDKVICLTSNDRSVAIAGAIYQPYSGLSIEKSVFNDSAQDYIQMNGIFEDRGIKSDDDLTSFAAEISVYFPAKDADHQLLTYHCNRMVRNNLQFTLYLEPIANKLNQTLLENFGPKCRANLGDHRCLVDLSAYPANTYCDKSLGTCCNKFNNGVNFRGEPFIPSGSCFF